jgi:uncharacterized membrane protein YdcZ (DUF606 family)
MTYLVILGFLAILGSLAAAMFFMLKGGGNEQLDGKTKAKRMARALAFRVGFSILLFICVLVAWKLGYIHPTGIAAGQ